MPYADSLMNIGQLAQRSGVATSALRYYEERGLILSVRNPAGHRRYPRHTLRRVAFIIAAQAIGLSLTKIRNALAELPNARTPNNADWAHLARSWLPEIDSRIAALERLRDGLTSCIGCGCLSLKVCRLYNPRDVAGATGAGARYLVGDSPPAGATPKIVRQRRSG
jgi:MerR family transcriptional regulator, redox-sensitive transcriptional activator SoxR